MTIELAQQIWMGIAIYFALGAAFALVFLTLLLRRFDANARVSAPLQFRLIILPGVMALWPILLILSLRPRQNAADAEHVA